MKRVLITGASGFVGRNCIPLLVAKGYEVHATTHQQLPKRAAPGTYWHEADLLSPGIAANLVGQIRPDALLHLAWYAVPGKFWEARENLDWVRASQELIGAFAEAGGKRLVAAGTCAEYDSTAGECVENKTPLLPATLYGKSKYAVEEYIQSSTWKPMPSFAWGRIFFMYGPYEPPSRVVAYAIRCLLQEEPALCSQGTQKLDFLHVKDVASAFIALLESEVQGPVNIGSGEANPLRVVLEEIGRQIGLSELIQFGAHKPEMQPASYWAKTQRLTKEVGWAPQYNLTSGIEQTINWWRNSGLISAPAQRKR